MIIYPAIDIYDGKAVRLFKGDYSQMTVYSSQPVEVARDFVRCGADYIHLVDLQGAKSGNTDNLQTVCAIKAATNAFCQIGGGIRSMEVVDKYLSAGIDRVILGTAAVSDEAFLLSAVEKYAERIAVGIDIRDGYVAIKGWTETSRWEAFAFCEKMQKIGIKTLICTDISRDGAMQGANHSLYERLNSEFDMQIIASGGVSSLEDVKHLAAMELHGAIIGKAYYTGAVSLKDAIEVAT